MVSRVEMIYTFVLTVWYFFITVVNLTTLDGTLLAVAGKALTIVWILTRIFIFVKIVSELYKGGFKVLLLLLFVLLSDYWVQGSVITVAIWFICGAKNIHIKKLIRPVFWAHFLGMSFIIILAKTGNIENLIYVRGNGVVRQSMGFYHPNTFAGHMIFLVSLYMMLHEKRMKLFNSLFILAAAIWTYKITDSRTGFILLLTLFVFSFLISIYQYNIKYIRRIMEFGMDKLKYIAGSMLIIVFYCTLYFDGSSDTVGNTFLSRISQAAIYFKYYSINLLGHSIELNYTLDNSELYTLDNAYIFLLLQSGVLIFALFVVGEIILARKKARQKDYTLLVILAVYAIYGFSETMFIRFAFNFTLLFLAEIVWPKQIRKQIPKQSYKQNLGQNLRYR